MPVFGDMEDPHRRAGVVRGEGLDAEGFGIQRTTALQQTLANVIDRLVVEVLNAHDAQCGVFDADHQMPTVHIGNRRQIADHIAARASYQSMAQALELLPFAGGTLLGEMLK